MELAVLAEPGVKKPPMPLFAVCDGVCSALGELRPTLEGWSWTESSFSIRSAKAFLVMSNGSKPRSSSCCLEEPNPKAACQSVDEDTGIVSGIYQRKYEISKYFNKYLNCALLSNCH